jgi:hypothetical protein
MKMADAMPLSDTSPTATPRRHKIEEIAAHGGGWLHTRAEVEALQAGKAARQD